MTQMVPVDSIRLDGGTQTRVGFSTETIKEYAQAYAAGNQFPDVVLFDDGERLWMADGFHRLAGARLAKRKEINAEIRKGTQRDALLYAAGCNGKHGLRRSNEDKRNAVKLLLADPEWANNSDRWIAEVCSVSADLVADVRRVAGSDNTQTDRRTGRDGRSYQATKPPRPLEREPGVEDEEEPTQAEPRPGPSPAPSGSRSSPAPTPRPSPTSMPMPAPRPAGEMIVGEAQTQTTGAKPSTVGEGKRVATEGEREEHRAKCSKNGREVYNYDKFNAAYRTLYREVDNAGGPFGKNNSPEAEGLRRQLQEFKSVFKKWFKTLYKSEFQDGI